jgi:hypothetical protein
MLFRPTDCARDLLAGPLVSPSGSATLLLQAHLCDLRPRFLAKGGAGMRYRAVARNGRVLLASDRPLAALAGITARLRLQSWHRVILEGDRPEPYGLLLCVRGQVRPDPGPLYAGRLVPDPEEPFALAIDLGGRLFLEFRLL